MIIAQYYLVMVIMKIKELLVSILYIYIVA